MTSVTSLGVTNYISQLWTCRDFSIFVNNWPSGWGNFFHILLVDTSQSSKAADSKPSSTGWGRARIGLGSWCLQCFASPGFRPTLPHCWWSILRSIPILSNSLLKSFLWQSITTIASTKATSFSSILKLFSLSTFSSYALFTLASEKRLFHEVLEFFSAFAELSKKFAIYQFKNNLGIGSVI